MLLSEASSRAIVLVSPHIPWDQLADRGDLVRQWVLTASTVSHTDEVAQGVANTLLQIASQDKLASYIPVDLWSWLTKRPSLPPICWGRYVGTDECVVKLIRALKDIEVLKSYLLVVWSEWDILQSDWNLLWQSHRGLLWSEWNTLRPYGSDEMCASILEDFGGIEMGHHRAELMQRLDHISGELDRGLDHFIQFNPRLDKRDMQSVKHRYRKYKRALLELENRTSFPMVPFFCTLTLVEIHAVLYNVYVLLLL